MGGQTVPTMPEVTPLLSVLPSLRRIMCKYLKKVLEKIIDYILEKVEDNNDN